MELQDRDGLGSTRAGEQSRHAPGGRRLPSVDRTSFATAHGRARDGLHPQAPRQTTHSGSRPRSISGLPIRFRGYRGDGARPDRYWPCEARAKGRVAAWASPTEQPGTANRRRKHLFRADSSRRYSKRMDEEVRAPNSVTLDSHVFRITSDGLRHYTDVFRRQGTKVVDVARFVPPGQGAWTPART